MFQRREREIGREARVRGPEQWGQGKGKEAKRDKGRERVRNAESLFAQSTRSDESERIVRGGARVSRALPGRGGGSGAPAGRLRMALAGAALLVALPLLAAAPASATFLHNTSFTSQFGPNGTSGTSFSRIGHLAYNQAAQKLYAVDRQALKIHAFQETSPGSFTTLTGNFPLTTASQNSFPGLAVDNTGGPGQGNLFNALNSSPATLIGYTGAGEFLPGKFPVKIQSGSSFCGATVDPEGHLWVGDQTAKQMREFDRFGNQIGTVDTSGQGGEPPTFNGQGCRVAFDSAGNMYVAFSNNGGGVQKYTVQSGYVEAVQFDPSFAEGGVAVDRSRGIVYVAHSASIIAYYPDGSRLETFGTSGGGGYKGIEVNEATGEVLAANFTKILVFPGKASPNATTKPATEVGHESATLNAHVELAGGPEVTTCKFEYTTGVANVIPASYSSSASCLPVTPYTGTTDPSAAVSGLTKDQLYHYRISVTTSNGTVLGQDRTFTPHAVLISTKPATGVTTTAAVLHGTVNPEGVSTTSYFQYGKTTAYGKNTATPPGTDIGTTTPGDQPVSAPLEGLEPGTIYHFRVVGANVNGTSFGDDATFTTAATPVIESTQATEVSATGATLHARINPSGYETTYRFEYGTTPAYGASAPDGLIPAATTGQPVTAPLTGLLNATYHFRVVAENQWGVTTGEDSTFTFAPETTCPNTALRQQTGAAYLPDCRAYELVSPGEVSGTILRPEGPTSPYATDQFAFTGLINVIPGTGEPINSLLGGGDMYVATRTSGGWTTKYVGLSGSQTGGQGGPFSGKGATAYIPTSENMGRYLTWDYGSTSTSAGRKGNFAPYMWNADGSMVTRLPTNVSEIPGAEKDQTEGTKFVGDAKPSGDFSHYFFSSRELAFAPGGLEAAPGSVYDNDVAAENLTIISKTPGGADIPQDPVGNALGANEFIKIPAASPDGSHVLMSTVAGNNVHLYLRDTDTGLSYNVSEGRNGLGEPDGVNHGVTLEGTDRPVTSVYFTSSEKLTPDDTDTSIDLYRWSENAGSPTLTRLSVGSGGSGSTDSCTATWTAKCNVVVVPYRTLNRRIGGPAEVIVNTTDNAIAEESGDVYFYSPEQLDGEHGIPGRRNLYVYRNGQVQFVTSLAPALSLTRLDVTPDGKFAAFITKSVLGSYNAGNAQMYRYDVEGRVLRCVSCRPDGSPATSNAEGSLDGRFISDDGRVFFYTRDALVASDVDGIGDVYEFVDGRPQLISSGTGGIEGATNFPAGLVGVSGDGVDVFFGTYDTLVSQDQVGPYPEVLRRPHRWRLPIRQRRSAMRGRGRVPRRRLDPAAVDLQRQRLEPGERRQCPPQAQAPPPQKEEEARLSPSRSRPEPGGPQMTAAIQNPGRGRRAALVLAATVAAVVLYAAIGSAQANAKAPVLFFASEPTGTQSGSHPNVVTTVEVGNVITQYPIPSCACDGPRDITVHAPAGVIANPHVVSECEPSQLQEFRCPSDAQVGLVILRTSINTSYIVMPLFRTTVSEGQAGRFVFQAPLSGSVPQYLVVSARTGGDFGLDIKATGINRTLPVEWLSTIFWGVPAESVHDPLRWAPAGVDNFGMGLQQREPVGADPQRRNSIRMLHLQHIRLQDARAVLAAHAAVHLEPDHLRRPAHGVRGLDRLRQRNRQPRSDLARNHRLRPAQLQPEPERKPDHGRVGFAIGSGNRPQSPPDPGRENALAVRDQRRQHRTAAGADDQLQRRRRQDLLLGRAGQPHQRRTGRMPGVRQNRHRHGQQLGVAGTDTGGDVPRRPAAGQHLPHRAHGGRLRHQRQIHRHGQTEPADRSARRQLPGTAAGAVPGAEHPSVRIRAWVARDTDPVRHLPGEDDLHPVGEPALRPDLDPVLHDRIRARTGLPAREPNDRSRRRWKPAPSTTRPAPLRVQLRPQAGGRRTEPRGPLGCRSAGLHGDPARRSVLPRVGDRESAGSRLHRPGRARRIRPAPPRVRSALPSPARAPGRTSSTSTARSTWPAPTKARR